MLSVGRARKYITGMDDLSDAELRVLITELYSLAEIAVTAHTRVRNGDALPCQKGIDRSTCKTIGGSK